MKLTLNNNGHTDMAGVFLTEAKILSIEELSGKPTYNDDPNSIYDLAVEVGFDIGQSWTKKVIFKGNFNENNPQNNWGSAFIVKEFFKNTGCFNNLTEDEIEERLNSFASKEIPPDFLAKVLNKNVYILDYIKGLSEDGKKRYSTWNRVNKNPDTLLEQFKKSISRGYPSNYCPEVLNQSIQNKISDSSVNEFVI